MENLIPFKECVIKFNVSLTNIVLLRFPQKHSKPQKTVYLINGKVDRKVHRTKKNVKLNGLSDIFYEIFCIFNQYRLITIL